MSFPFIAREDARVLILGSMPSIASIAAGHYYAHPRNAFWRMLPDIWERAPLEDWQSREAFLYEKHIALWDVAQTCVRQGSADHTIQDVELNDFRQLFARCPRITHIFINGTKAMQLFRGAEMPDDRAFVIAQLPSTSPANTMPYEQKLSAWSAVRQTVDAHA